MNTNQYQRPKINGKLRSLPRVLHRLDSRIRKQGLFTSGRWLLHFIRAGIRDVMPRADRAQNMKNYVLWIINNIDLKSDCFHVNSLGKQIAKEINVSPATITRMTHEMIRMGLFVNPWATNPLDPKSGQAFDKVHCMQMPQILCVTDEFWQTLEVLNGEGSINEEREFKRSHDSLFSPIHFLESLRKKVIEGVWECRKRRAKISKQNDAVKEEITREAAVKRVIKQIKKDSGTTLDVTIQIIEQRIKDAGWKAQKE